MKISLSSCSETNWPRLATKRVEQGALLTAMLGCEDDEPTGEARAGEGKKCGSEACSDVRVVGCGRDIDACYNRKIQDRVLLLLTGVQNVAILL